MPEQIPEDSFFFFFKQFSPETKEDKEKLCSKQESLSFDFFCQDNQVKKI